MKSETSNQFPFTPQEYRPNDPDFEQPKSSAFEQNTIGLLDAEYLVLLEEPDEVRERYGVPRMKPYDAWIQEANLPAGTTLGQARTIWMQQRDPSHHDRLTWLQDPVNAEAYEVARQKRGFKHLDALEDRIVPVQREASSKPFPLNGKQKILRTFGMGGSITTAEAPATQTKKEPFSLKRLLKPRTNLEADETERKLDKKERKTHLGTMANHLYEAALSVSTRQAAERKRELEQIIPPEQLLARADDIAQEVALVQEAVHQREELIHRAIQDSDPEAQPKLLDKILGGLSVVFLTGAKNTNLRLARERATVMLKKGGVSDAQLLQTMQAIEAAENAAEKLLEHRKNLAKRISEQWINGGGAAPKGSDGYMQGLIERLHTEGKIRYSYEQVTTAQASMVNQRSLDTTKFGIDQLMALRPHLIGSTNPRDAQLLAAIDQLTPPDQIEADKQERIFTALEQGFVGAASAPQASRAHSKPGVRKIFSSIRRSA